MPSLGPAEILVILVVALLVFGPNKMPEIGRQVARGVREFRKIQHHLSSELQSVVSDLDLNGTAPPQPTPGGDPPPTLPPKETAAGDASAVADDGAESPSPPAEPA
jgi:sec-independent protein translocase protein TatA